MRTRSLVLIALRMYAIYWFFTAGLELASALVYLPFLGSLSSYAGRTVPWVMVIVPAVMLVLSIVLWKVSTRVSGVIVRDFDVELSTVTLTREDLYAFAFVFLGLFFVLSSIPSVIDGGYAFLTQDALLPESDPRHGREMLPFLGHSLSLIVGFACVLGASKWSRKLARKD
ncbi:MAG TPA: hypothetical protein VHY09_08190 [Candidatus Methylacidiphilales bacterium]|jgi:hypothetical protein|nr:hypothetical protein [Candidatus Methylacidiphilales bacterium]